MDVSVNLLLRERNVDCIWISTIVRTLSANVTHRPVEMKLKVLIGRSSSRQEAHTLPPAPLQLPLLVCQKTALHRVAQGMFQIEQKQGVSRE